MSSADCDGGHCSVVRQVPVKGEGLRKSIYIVGVGVKKRSGTLPLFRFFIFSHTRTSHFTLRP